MKKFLKVLGIVVVVFLVWWVISASYYIWKARSLRQKTEDFQAALSRPYREDTYGGKTPEETWAMFLEALKNKDAELASKYFVPEKQEEWKKNIINSVNKNQIDLAIKNIEKINFETSTSNTAYFNYNISSEEFPGITKNPVVFILNPYTKVWKISVL